MSTVPKSLPSAGLLSWPDLQVALASSTVEIGREQEVRTYLESHPDLVAVTREIGKAARREFGSDASLTLDLYQDLEIVDEYLVLDVRLRTYGADTLSRIRSVSDAFHDALCDSSGSILLTTNFGALR